MAVWLAQCFVPNNTHCWVNITSNFHSNWGSIVASLWFRKFQTFDHRLTWGRIYFDVFSVKFSMLWIYKSSMFFSFTGKPTKGVDVDAVGEINGVPTYEFDINGLQPEERPWHKPGRTGFILWMLPANERQRYNVTSSSIGCAYTQNDPGRIWISSKYSFLCWWWISTICIILGHRNDWIMQIQICHIVTHVSVAG